MVQNLTVGVTESLHRLCHAPCFDRPINFIGATQRVESLGRGSPGANGVAPPTVIQRVAHDGVQPRSGRSSAAVECLGMLPRPEQRILYRFLSALEFSRQTKGEGIEFARVAIMQGTQHLVVEAILRTGTGSETCATAT